ncbi:hypothetical protein P4B35_06055 [Pontiellaceae bacterium B12227]|nr:hypothetical protein [Pontiellaceae bacterium B12227]
MGKKTLSTVGICLLMVAGSQAANVVWNGSESIYWGNTNNWNVGYLPGATANDQGIIQAGSPVTVAANFSVVTFGTDLTVRSDETLNVQADFTNWDQIRVGWNSGHVGYVNHSAGAVGAVDLFVGNGGTATANSVYTMTGGTLSLSDQLWSRNQGEFNQSGGTTIAARFDVNDGGTAALSGGSTTFSGAMTIGSGSSATVSGTGALTAGTITANDALNVSGGSVNASTLNANSIVTLSGGSLIGTNLNVSGIMNQTGGTLNAPTVTTVSSGGNLTQSAGTSTHAALTVDSGGAAGVSGTATLNATTLTANGTLNVSAGALNAATLNVNDSVNHSGSGLATVNTLNVNASGNYNLTGGTLNTEGTTITVAGLIDVDGGTVSIDQGPANVAINGAGLLTLKSGTLEATGSAATDLLDINTDIEISGGSLNLLGQTRVNGEFKVVGDAATINLARLSAAGGGSMSLVFDDTGVSTVNVSGWMTLSDMDLVVDGTAYTGSETSFVLLDAVNNTASLNSYTVTGFGTEGVDWELVQTTGVTGNDGVVLNVIPEPAVLSLVVIFGGGILVLKRRLN